MVGRVTSSPSLGPLPALSIDCDAKNSSEGLFGDSNEGAASLMNLSLGLSQGGQWIALEAPGSCQKPLRE